MGITTVTASRIYEGQAAAAQDGVSHNPRLRALPYVPSEDLFQDAQVTDSAPCATAMMTGVKRK